MPRLAPAQQWKLPRAWRGGKPPAMRFLVWLGLLWSLPLMLTGAGVASELPYAFATTPGRLPKTVLPSHYRIELRPNLGALTFTGSAGPGATVDLLIHLPVVVVLVNAPHPLDPSPAVTDLDVVAWRADDELTVPVTDEPEYLRALFNTESTWAAARSAVSQESEALT